MTRLSSAGSRRSSRSASPKLLPPSTIERTPSLSAWRTNRRPRRASRIPTSSNTSRSAAMRISSPQPMSSACTVPPGNTYAPAAKSDPPGRCTSRSSHGSRPRTSSTVADGRGAVDILVNNLGLRAGSSWSDTGAEEFERAFEGNVTVSVRMSQLVLQGMLDRGWGRIVTITSVWGRETGGAPAYNAAKAAEISFTKSLALEVAARGVTVNSVAPGSILWPGGGWDRRQKADPAGIAEFVRRDMPLGRFGTVEEVAAVVTFVCSKQASLVNGAVIAVDGGQSRSGI